MSRFGSFSGAIVVATACYATAASANPRPLPFTYNYDTLPKGEGEVEQYVDIVPLKATDATKGTNVWYAATQFQTEFEYGIFDRLELGLYVEFQPTPSNLDNAAVLTEGTGIKERLKYRLFEQGDAPIDTALYAELVETQTEFEIEAKIILEKRFGDLRIAANLWGEREFYYAQNQQDWVFNPTAGITYQVTPAFHAGIEWWARKEWTSSSQAAGFNLDFHQYVGPALMVNFGRIWWSTGIYARLDNLNYSLAPGDAYGPIWCRSVIGLNL